MSAACPPGWLIQFPFCMSFAVSAIVRPSRRLRCLLAAFCATLLATSLVVGIGTPERFAFDGLVAFTPLAGALALAWPLTRSWGHAKVDPQLVSQALLHGFGTARRLDISGLGQLRLTVQQEMRAVARPLVTGSTGHASEGIAVTLLPGATVWPCCILLRLRAPDGTAGTLAILPDSMSADDFRALAVAVRALANGAPEKTSTQNTLNLLQEANS
ncbi:protein YgfX [Massilia aurea]|uniref:protein YgfX n=1 Tax=Massilia aurea TaxID=373040 RepID=UPI003461DB9A